jgi:tRNA-dihydrouridine synthase B
VPPPWFQNDAFPLFLAPMAGVTDVVFRSLCKEFGADVMLTEFVSAEGVLRRSRRTAVFTDFTEDQRPLGIQFFGADGPRMAEAARRVIEWRRPDFIDLNFGCPVSKVVAKNGGSSLLKDLPALSAVARAVVEGVGDMLPVTAKIRTGWDSRSVNALEVCRLLEDCGVQAITVHGRTRSQGYSGEADWETIASCARAVSVPVVGNGDIASGADAARRKRETAVAGVMIGRAAMARPWIFRDIKQALATGAEPPQPTLAERWEIILRHCRMAVEGGRFRNEAVTMTAMRARLAAYCKGFPGARHLRPLVTKVTSVAEVEAIATQALAECAELEERT